MKKSIALIFSFFLICINGQIKNFVFKNGETTILDKDFVLNQKYESHIKLSSLKNYTAFDNSHENFSYDHFRIDFPSEYISADFNSFTYLKAEKHGEKSYILAASNLGFWLFTFENGITKPYFLGLAKDKFIHLKLSSKLPMIKDNTLQLECAIVRQTRALTRPVISNEDLPSYEALKDGLLLKIKLNDILKDSDNDGYNDLLENYVGLNPHSKDSDNDGIDDFTDSNPLYPSIENELTIPLNIYLNGGYTIVFHESEKMEPVVFKEKITEINPFNFEIFRITNESLKYVNPKNKKVLLFMENENQRVNFDIDNYSNCDVIKKGLDDYEIYSSFSNGASRFNLKKVNNIWYNKLIGGYAT